MVRFLIVLLQIGRAARINPICSPVGDQTNNPEIAGFFGVYSYAGEPGAPTARRSACNKTIG